MKKITLLRAGINTPPIKMDLYPVDSTTQIIELAKAQFGLKDNNCVLLKSDGTQINSDNIYDIVEDDEKLILSPTVIGGGI